MGELKIILDELDVGRVSEHIKWLVSNTPYRIAGSDDEKRAADYVVSRLREYGLEAKNDCFRVFNSVPRYSKLEVLQPGSRSLKSLPCAHIKSTPKEGGEYELVYAGSGSYEDYKGLEVRGKAVLVEVSYSPPTPEKARIANELGVSAMIFMNWGNGEPVICNRGLKAVWGNPTEETLNQIPQVAGISIMRSDGEYLKKLCLENRRVTVRLAAISDPEWCEVRQPIAVLRGGGESDQFIVVGSHLDAWKPGVTCNATGNATTLELARVLAEHREKLDRDIWFVFWNGHEIAEAAGSTWFVDNYWNELNKNCIAYLNLDSTGLGGATLYEIKAADELYDYAYENARSLLPKTMDIRMTGLPKIGDQSFFGIGVPAVAERMSYTEEFIKSSNGVTLGWWNHTSEDGYDKYSPENVVSDLRVNAGLLYGLSASALLPYGLGRRFDSLRGKLERAAADCGDKIDLTDLEAEFERTEELVLELDRRRGELSSEQIGEYNQFQLAVCRGLYNVFFTYADKYQQDSYGHGYLNFPVPLLAGARRLGSLDPGSFEYGLIHTQLVKNKNRITDALINVARIADSYRKILF